MARLSNVHEGLIQVAGRKPKSHTTYGRHNRNKSLSRVYDLPLSPPKELRPRRSWTSINKDRSARQIGNGLTPPRSTQKLLAKSSPASSPAPKPLRESTKGGLGPRPIANESIVQSTHVPALQPRTAPNRSPVQSRSKLPPKPTISESNAGKSAAVEATNQAEFPPPDINQLSKGVGNLPVSDDHTQPSTAADNLTLGPSDDTEMEEVNGEGDPGEEKHSPTHARDGDDEYFEVEAIKSCKLSSRGMVLLRVKWKGYEDPSDITWEPEKALRDDIPQVIDVYFEEQGGREKVLNGLRTKRVSEKVYRRKRGIARAKGRASKSGV